MTKEQIVQKLQDRSSEDKKFKAVANVLALRKRDRFTMSARGLWLKMRREGFSYKESEFIPVLEFLAQLGLGKAETDNNGRVVSLRNLRMPIPLLGQAACGKKIDLDKIDMDSIDNTVPFEAIQRPAKIAATKQTKQAPADGSDVSMTLVVQANGTNFDIPVPANASPDELAGLIRSVVGVAKHIRNSR